MSDNNSRFPERKKMVLDNDKLRLRAPNAKGKMAALNWGLYSNNPRLTVYTHDPDDTVDNGVIRAALDAPTFFAFLELLSEAINSREAFRKKIDNLNYTFPGGRRSETPSVVSSLIVGREDDGTIYVSIAAPRRPVVKFPFTNPEFHNFFHGDGTQYSKADISNVYARSYLRMLSTLMTTAMDSNYTPPKPREDNGGNRNGGGGGNKGGWGGNKNGGGGASYGGGRQEQPAPAATADNFDDWP